MSDSKNQNQQILIPIQTTDTEDIPLDDNDQQEKQQQKQQQNHSQQKNNHQHSSPTKTHNNFHQQINKPLIEKIDIQTEQDDKQHQINLSDIANPEMHYEEDHTIGDIKIRVTGSVQRQSTFSQYTTYLILGEDAKGKFQLARRYSQFDALRALLKQRWPGCFIPTLPEKNLNKNSPQTIAERERLLDDFLKKLAFNKNIFYGDQVQLFLRSGETDITANFEKQPKLGLEEIINKYRNVFNELAGKQPNSGATIKISTFKTCLKKIQQQLPQLLDAITNLAESKDHLNSRLPGLTQILQAYQKNTIAQFSEGSTKNLIYTNIDNLDLQEQDEKLKNISKGNPFWFLSDLIKIEQKDCVSFVQTIQLLDRYNQKRLSLENDIRNMEKQIEQLALGNSTISSMTTRKSKDEVKKSLEEKNKKAIEEKHHLIEIADMVIALIAYLQIDNYKLLKRKYYSTILKRLTGHEAYAVLNLQKMWGEVFRTVEQIQKE